ncbi:DUF4062 domain-containing protein [Naasia sp. SYSU D00057]|uniref:ATP-binding protein n=1 Tax=Naasia sp. SYSU D00057 TaxID=2817380 RepID=UPI001B316F75|nr:DUF4062 domain-containing protein [Naasia sp. SYSU D00057]
MTPAPGRSAIRTPDQRLRVFVSSTLKELAPERAVARSAIERLAAAPVMFELGARPHPPRDLYRAYLEQSDIFVGLYWERYGWVAPGEDVSGLEDEYNLAPPDMPRLIYIKETAGAREPRLTGLLDRIRSDDRASFKYFSDPAELADLLVADLAVLLAERFDESRAADRADDRDESDASPAPSGRVSLPAPLTQLYGREDAIDSIADRLRSPEVRLLTLTGPGGIGKTRLAIEVARRLAPEYPDGVTFVPLAPVDSAAQVPGAIAQVLGVRDTGESPVDQKLVTALRSRRTLLVLDNFEQVLDAAPLVAALLSGAPGLRLLVTSRALLRLSGEHSVEVSPLGLPPSRTREWHPDEPPSPAVALLVERARSVKPDFELTADNVADVEAITARLEGVPLAIELAAARLRLLSPAALLERLDRRLSLLVGGQRDLPPRQRAVRSTIEWSTRLLKPDEQDLLWRLGVFAGRFSLEAVECMADPGADALALLETLVDSSLVRQQDRTGRSYFLLLATVREYALERLDEEGLLEQMRERHARYYLGWAQASGREVIGAGQRECVVLVTNERDNLRAAERHFLDARDWTGAAGLAWALWPYWWISGMLGEAKAWMEELLARGHPLPDDARAVALCIVNASFFWEEPAPSVIAGLSESADLFERLGRPAEAGVPLMSLTMAYTSGPKPELDRAEAAHERGLRLFRAAGDRWGESVLLISGGMIELVRGDREHAIERFERSLRLADEQQDDLARTLALHHLGWIHLLGGDPRSATGYFADALHASLRLDHQQGIAWGLEGLLGVAGATGDVERAGILAGAAEALRERIGVPDKADAIFHGRVIEHLRGGQHTAEFERGHARGLRMLTEEAVAVAEAVAATAAAAPDGAPSAPLPVFGLGAADGAAPRQRQEARTG